jgi:hypothetical protein
MERICVTWTALLCTTITIVHYDPSFVSTATVPLWRRRRHCLSARLVQLLDTANVVRPCGVQTARSANTSAWFRFVKLAANTGIAPDESPEEEEEEEPYAVEEPATSVAQW